MPESQGGAGGSAEAQAASSPLFTPVQFGAIALGNRMVMAPLTRMRAGSLGIPTVLNAQYYAQRASAGLIVTESTQVSPFGRGYVGSPGIHDERQVAGWSRVTEAVHARGGRIVLQLWHAGRRAHSSFLPGHALPVAPSAVRSGGEARLPGGPGIFDVPRVLSTDEIAVIVEQFRQGAANARAAGFDGVEVHGANGYLIEQFLNDRTNKRTDAYGGSAENRTRFLVEVVQAVVGVFGPERVGVRLSPFGTACDSGDSDPATTHGAAIRALAGFGLAYLHLIEPRVDGNVDGSDEAPSAVRLFRPLWRGRLIAAGGFTRERAEAVLEEGLADAVAFGRLYIANPDLAERFRHGAALNAYDRATFYTPGARGYTDYPALPGAANG